MPYELEGNLLEVCDCKVLCPCWIGEDPDNGTCDTILAYKMAKGNVNGTDVKGLSLALMAHIPANILQGNWKVALFVDEKATKEQEDALIGVWTGKFGGPVADLAKFVGEVVAVKRAPITFDLKEGRGTLIVGDAAECVMAPFKGPGDRVTTLNDSIFSTIPGAPAYVSKAETYKRNTKDIGLRNVDLKGHNAIQGSFKFVC